MFFFFTSFKTLKVTRMTCTVNVVKTPSGFADDVPTSHFKMIVLGLGSDKQKTLWSLHNF